MTKQNATGAFLAALRAPEVAPNTASEQDQPRKLRVNLEVDADILAHFPGTGTERKDAIHQVLRDYVDGLKG